MIAFDMSALWGVLTVIFAVIAAGVLAWHGVESRLKENYKEKAANLDKECADLKALVKHLETDNGVLRRQFYEGLELGQKDFKSLVDQLQKLVRRDA